ncbi:unnamed protein product, partial [marine sediment metagenome]
VRSDVPLTVAQSGQKLYIADYGDLRITQEDVETVVPVKCTIPWNKKHFDCVCLGGI